MGKSWVARGVPLEGLVGSRSLCVPPLPSCHAISSFLYPMLLSQVPFHQRVKGRKARQPWVKSESARLFSPIRSLSQVHYYSGRNEPTLLSWQWLTLPGLLNFLFLFSVSLLFEFENFIHECTLFASFPLLQLLQFLLGFPKHELLDLYTVYINIQ